MRRWLHMRRLRGQCDVLGGGVVDGSLRVSNQGYLEIGRGVRIHAVSAQSHLAVGPGGRLVLGDDVYMSHGVAVAAHAEVTIGAGTRIGPFVMIMDTDFHEVGRHDSSGSRTPIRIGAGVVLGARVTVLRGSTIGDGAVVAAGSVVKGHIAPGAHVAGVPARSQDVRSAPGQQDADWDSVASVVVRTFGLSDALALETKRQAIPEWDSLGTLNLLLALEQQFDVTLAPSDVYGVATAGDLVTLLRDRRRLLPEREPRLSRA